MMPSRCDEVDPGMQVLTREIHGQFQAAADRFSPPLATAIARIGPIGYRRRRTRDLGEHLARVIVGQQLSTLAARAIWARVTAAAAGARVLASCGEAQRDGLRACGLSHAKITALIALRTAETDGLLDVRRLGRLDPVARRTVLTGLKGIGPWSADMVSMFFFRETDIWPLGDLAVRKTFTRFVATQRRYDLDGAARLFAPYRSFLALYMWRIANDGPDE
jgi:DNA-3-methyladenine glycosylase II